MERESLKEINEELRCSQAQEQQFSQAGDTPMTDVWFCLAVLLGSNYCVLL